MIGTIRKHSKWLWLVIVTITIFSFVYWGSQSSGRRDSSGRVIDFGSIDGVPVTMEEYLRAKNEIDLRYFFKTGDWPGKRQQADYDERRDTYSRLALIRKLNDYNIQVDNISVARVASQILRGFSRGEGNVDLNLFVQQILAPRGMSGADFQRYIQHDLAIQQLFSILGLSGSLITPEEARSLYEREYRELATEVVFFNASNHLAGIAAPSPDVLVNYYTNRKDSYTIPERVQVHFVEFSLTNTLAEAEKTLTNLNELVDLNFRQMGSNYVRFGRTPEEAKSNIRQGIIHQQAKDGIRAIRDKADRLVGTLMEMEKKDLPTVAKTNGLACGTTAPFVAQAGPAEFDGGPNFARLAFTLTPEAPVAEQSVESLHAFYVIALAQRFPSEVPPLEKIRTQVVADYQFDQAKSIAWREAQTFVATATNAAVQGKSFDAICADAKVKPIVLAPFSRQRGELPQIENLVNPYAFKQTAFQIPAGKISEAFPVEGGALVIYPKQLLPLDKADMDKHLPEFIMNVRWRRQAEAVNEWFAREAQRSWRGIQLESPKPDETAEK